jgi:hypothetical protein
MKLDTGFVGGVHEEEIDDPRLDELSPEDFADAIEGYAQGMISNHIEVSWKRVDEDEQWDLEPEDK